MKTDKETTTTKESFFSKVKRLINELDIYIINNLTYGLEEYYESARRTFHLFTFVTFLLVLSLVIYNAWYKKANSLVIINSFHYVIAILIIVMFFALRATNRINNSAKKKAKELEENK